MSYSAIKITDIGQDVDPFVNPKTDAAGNLIEEPLDHGLRHKVTANAIRVYRRTANQKEFEEMLLITDIEIEVCITDSRVIYRCMKYDKGDRKWSGGLTALALNAYEKSKANRRSAGTMLIGHVRYEWLRQIQYSNYNKQKWLEYDDFCLRLFYKDNSEAFWIIQTNFPKTIDTAFLANDILHRMARYRMAMTDEKQDRMIEHNKQCATLTITPSANPKEQYSSFTSIYSYYAPGGEEYRPKTDSAPAAPAVASAAPAAPVVVSAPKAPTQAAPIVIKAPTPTVAPTVVVRDAAAPAPDQWVCPNCGTENDPHGGFCRICGSRRRAEAPSKWFCPSCGTENDPEGRFCRICGHRRP